MDTKQHNHPHIHVKYGELEAIYKIPDGILLDGFLPSNKEKLIQAFSEIKQNIKLILVGPDDFFSHRIKQQIKELKEEKRIVFYR